MSRAPRYALFGGSFDPVHFGHLVVADFLRHAERLDRVLFVPAQRSPHKRRTRADTADRVAMLRLALRGNSGFRVSDLEARRPGPSYTIETVRTYARRWGVKPFLILGADALLDLPTWHESRALLLEARIVAFARPGFPTAARTARRLRVRYHEIALTSLSSSMVRDLVRRGRPIRYRVPDAVRRYIQEKRLYGTRTRDEA